MSNVISFRLNPENPREAEALTVLQDWLTQGFSTRHTITEALLKLDASNSHTAENQVLEDLSHQIKELLGNFESGSSLVLATDGISSQKKLSDGFVSSILKTAKPGMKIDA